MLPSMFKKLACKDLLPWTYLWTLLNGYRTIDIRFDLRELLLPIVACKFTDFPLKRQESIRHKDQRQVRCGRKVLAIDEPSLRNQLLQSAQNLVQSCFLSLRITFHQRVQQVFRVCGEHVVNR